METVLILVAAVAIVWALTLHVKISTLKDQARADLERNSLEASSPATSEPSVPAAVVAEIGALQQEVTRLEGVVFDLRESSATETGVSRAEIIRLEGVVSDLKAATAKTKAVAVGAKRRK
jgi:hypothetical protein